MLLWINTTDVYLKTVITEICYLEDVKEDDAESLGLTKFEYRRLARLYADFKDSPSSVPMEIQPQVKLLSRPQVRRLY